MNLVRRARARCLAFVAVALASPLVSSGAFALDKQGSAHGGEVGGADDGFDVSGAVILGSSLYNPTYAARPDNTGLALFRYALHTDFDLIGRNLSIPLDINMFTNRLAHGLGVFVPSEFDLIVGVTTTQPTSKSTDLEIGARVETDRSIGGESNYSQTYADVRLRALYSLARQWPSLGDALWDGDLSGYFTFGWFAINPTYAARPDNTGLALFRYTEHAEIAVWERRVALGFDATFFTDRKNTRSFQPTELDFTAELIGRFEPFEAHLAYERDMPLDQGHFVQSFLYLLFVYGFDFGLNAKPASSLTAVEPPPPLTAPPGLAPQDTPATDDP